MGLRNDELIGGNRLSINLSRVMAKTQVVYSLLTNAWSSYVLWKNMLMFLTSLILGYLEVHLAWVALSFVLRKFTSLLEGFATDCAFVGSLTCVYVEVIFQVLNECKAPPTYFTDERFVVLLMWDRVSLQTVFGLVFLVATGVLAAIN